MKLLKSVILVNIISSFFSSGLVLATSAEDKGAPPFVQIETGALVHEIADLELSDGKSTFSMNRIYKHSGREKGILGSSWCFSFEEEIRSEDDGYRLVNCGKATGVYFKKIEDHYLFESERLERTPTGQFKRASATSIIFYDEFGRMISEQKKNQEKLFAKTTFSYSEDGLLMKINFLKSYEIEFNYDKNNKLAFVTSRGKRIASYNVIEEGLVSVRNAFGSKFSYDYDDLGYLTHWQNQDGKEEKYTYDRKTKLVSEQVTAEGCNKLLDYSQEKSGKLNLKMKDSCLMNKEIQISFSDKIPQIKKSKKKSDKNFEAIVVKRDLQNRVNQIEDNTKTWSIEYSENLTTISAISETNKKTGKIKIYKAKYKNGQIAELSESGKSKLKFVYSKDGEFLRLKPAKGSQSAPLISKFEKIHLIAM